MILLANYIWNQTIRCFEIVAKVDFLEITLTISTNFIALAFFLFCLTYPIKRFPHLYSSQIGSNSFSAKSEAVLSLSNSLSLLIFDNSVSFFLFLISKNFNNVQSNVCDVSLIVIIKMMIVRDELDLEKWKIKSK